MADRGCVKTFPRGWVAVLGGFLLLALPVGSSGGPAAGPQPPPNIVFVFTDDQRWDSLWAMPTVRREIVGKGVDFRRAFVVNPMCCPSRASTLAGRYSHTTGVYSNAPPHGGFPVFRDGSTVAVWLDRMGYRTGLIGKYLNKYDARETDYIPPGWDRWFAFTSDEGNGGYFDYTVSDQGVPRSYGRAPEDYSTDVLAAEADAFIRNTDPHVPLFLYFVPNAPHDPFIPAPRHEGAFADLAPARPPNFNEQQISDKPLWLRVIPRLTPEEVEGLDALRRAQYRTLLAVDEAVGTIVRALEDTGRIGSTMIVFASDNGYLLGEHRLRRKGFVHEESIRIPLVIRYDPLPATPRPEAALALNIDLAPTFAQLAGARVPTVDGRALLPLLTQTPARWRTDFVIEHLADEGHRMPSYCAVRSKRYLYAYYAPGGQELYDLRTDPYQLQSLMSDPAYEPLIEHFRQRLRVMCDPPPPGMILP